MVKIRNRAGRAVGAILAGMVLGACGTSGPTVASHSPVAGTPTAAATPSPGQSPSAQASPMPADLRLVIWDIAGSQVRLARLDARDTASIKGAYQGVVDHKVIVLNGTTLQALSLSGSVKTLGHLSGEPGSSVVVAPGLAQWLYMAADANFIYRLHVGSATGDRIVATSPSPTDEQIFRPFAWNATGIYVTREPLGLGGAGPFLEYHFPVGKLDLTSGKVVDLSPTCVGLQALDDGTMLCQGSDQSGRTLIEVRPPTGRSNVIKMASDSNGYIDVAVSTDHQRLIAGRNGSKNPVINYQMAVADLSSPSAQAFGAIDFVPETWLPDGRLVADHRCVITEWGGGRCDARLDGTYFFSADGTSRQLFYKLTRGVVVGWI